MAKNTKDIFEHEAVEEFCTKPVFDDDGVQVSAAIGQDGREYVDPVPMAPPVGYDPGPDLMTMIRTMIHHERFKEAVLREGAETFEEADDFDLPDDPLDPLTPYESVFDPNTGLPLELPKEINPGASAGQGGGSQPPPPPTPASPEVAKADAKPAQGPPPSGPVPST